MKNKTVATIFAFFIGSLGVHRFYLGQIGMGILYLLLSVTGISTILGIIDGIVFLSMDNAVFDSKYNRRERDYYEDREHQYRERRNRYEPPQRQRKHTTPPPPPATTSRANEYKKEGIERYKDYDFDDAIIAFNKALKANPEDIAVHFNIACAYSITENAEKAFYHLSKAVEYGFSDFSKIKEHDALAYIRIQDEFEAFEQNGFKLSSSSKTPSTPEISENLLDQIKRLGELREKGFLTQEEFIREKKKLLR